MLIFLLVYTLIFLLWLKTMKYFLGFQLSIAYAPKFQLSSYVAQVN
jgi:hypothetical protein